MEHGGRLGPLHGLPISVKEHIGMKGPVDTSHGGKRQRQKMLR